MIEQKKNKERGRAIERARLLWNLLCGSKKYFVICIAASFLVAACDILLPQIIRTTIDSVIGDKETDAPGFLLKLIDLAGGVDALASKIWLIALSIVVIAALQALFRYVTITSNTRGGEILLKGMRDKLFSHIQRLPYSWHMKNQTGDIIQRCTSDVDVIKNFVSDQLTSVFRIIILIVFSLFCMYYMDLRLATIAALSVPVIVGYSAYFYSRMSKSFLVCDEHEGVLSTIAQENLTGVRVVRAFGREVFERDRFEKQNNIYTDAWLKLCRLLTAYWSSGDLLSGLQVALVFVFGTVFCVRGTLTEGELIAFISYSYILMWPVRRLGRMIAEMSKAGVSIDRIAHILDSPQEADKPGALCPDMRADIEFSHVTFAYEEGKEVLSDVSFKIPKGTVFGILGATGSGKSTLVHLLCRLYDLPPENGKITIGGVDVADIKASWLRKNIGIVLQEPFLFSRTLGENVKIAAENCTDEQLEEAAATACLDTTVKSFTQGWDTLVGERGVTLSGGQKQRVAIARMLLKNSPIMILDDSLSAVDTETDEKIRTALKKHFGDATVILISHRITTLMLANQIIVLDKGRIVESGTHEQLIEQNGIYKKIYDLQMKMEEAEIDA
jgi:ATP-binding cassette subfamily B protein